MKKRTAFLTAAALTLLAAATPILGQPANGGLKDVYANRFRFGSILNGSTVNNAAMKTIVLREFNSITPENELKPDATILQSGSTNDDVKVQLNNGARAILKFCQDNKIPVRGHTLVWHSQTPEWFFKENFQTSGNWVTPAVMDKRMESYIKNMFALIKKDFPTLNLYAYDVVNEAASESGSPRTGGSDVKSGQSMWVQVYKDNSFIEKAFTYARKYAPATTKLFYNDYNEYIQAKRDYIANSIVKPLKQKGLLDGVGMQSHLDVRTGNDAYPSATLYGQAVTIYKNLGVEIHVTELDATVKDGNNSYLPAQATYYKDIMSEIIAKGGSAVTAVVVWGIQDDQSWRKPNLPLLFDASANKKAAYTELVKLIPQSEWGDGNNPVGGGVIEPPPPPPPVNPDANGFFFYHPFETSTHDWAGRGAAAVARTTAQKANGSSSLSVSGRTAEWNGAYYSLNTNAFVPGHDYSFSVTAMYASGTAEADTFKLTMQYKDAKDSTRYSQVASARAEKGQWVQLSNKQFPIPSGAANLLLYVEMPKSLTDFYIDDAMGGISGASIGSNGQPGGGTTPVAIRNTSTRKTPLVTVRDRTINVFSETDAKVKIKIADMRGKTITNTAARNGDKLSLRTLPAGAYIVEAERQDGYRTTAAVIIK